DEDHRAHPQDQPDRARGRHHHPRSRLLLEGLAGALRLQTAQRRADRRLCVRRAAPRPLRREGRTASVTPRRGVANGLQVAAARERSMVRLASKAALVVALGVVAWAPAALAQTAPQATSPSASKGGIPDLASVDFAWLAMGADWRDPPAGAGHGRIKPD